MKLVRMTLNTILLFSTLTVFASSNEQSPSKEISIDSPPAISKGEIVYELPDSTIIVFQDKNNNYWFGSNGKGLYFYDGKNMIRLTTKDGLSDDRISKIEEDPSGNIYITTGSGISKFDGKSFSTLKPVTGIENTWKLESDDLWFKRQQDSGVVYRYDGKMREKDFPYEKKKGIGNPKDFNKDSAKDALTYFMSGTVESTGALWLVTFSAGVWQCKNETLTPYPIKSGEKTVTLFSIYKDRQGFSGLEPM